MAITPRTSADLMADAIAVVARQDVRFRNRYRSGRYEIETRLTLEGRLQGNPSKSARSTANLSRLLDAIVVVSSPNGVRRSMGDSCPSSKTFAASARTIVARRVGPLHRLTPGRTR